MCTKRYIEIPYLETTDPREPTNALKLYAKLYTCILLRNRCKIFLSFSKGSISFPTHLPPPSLPTKNISRITPLGTERSLILLHTSKTGQVEPPKSTRMHQETEAQEMLPLKQQFYSKTFFEEN